MLILAAAAAIAASSPPPGPTATPAAVHATATVRILSGTRLTLGATKSGEGFSARAAIVRTAGSSQPAVLIEFE